MLKKIQYITLIGLMFIVASCEKIVSDLNKDPDNPTNATAEFVFKGTQIANMGAQEGLASRLTLVWTGYAKGTFLQFDSWGKYQITAFNFDADWNIFFAGVNKNALIAIEKANQINNRKMAGITKILRAHAMGTATELWGDIPFSEASNPAEFPNPKFETQEELYPKLHLLLDEAIDDLKSGIGTVGVDDLHLAGNAAKWIEVAYTLKARLFTDFKKYNEAYDAASKGVSKYENSLYSPHGNIRGGNENSTYSLLTNVRAGSITAEGVYNALLLNPAHNTYRGNAKTNETARYQFYYLEKGVNAAGVIEPNTLTTSSKRGFFAQDASYPLITFQENMLTLAEMAIRSGKGFDIALGHLNTYRAFLNAGGYLHATYKVIGEYKYENYLAGDFANGGMENKDGISAEDALLREILEERYVTFYGQHTGWNDERRARKEAVGIKLLPNNGTQLPYRFIYSQNELNSNANSPQNAPSLFDPTSIYK